MEIMDLYYSWPPFDIKKPKSMLRKEKNTNHPMSMQCILKKHGYIKVLEGAQRIRVYRKEYQDGVWGEIVTQHQKVIRFMHIRADQIKNRQRKVEALYIIKEGKDIKSGKIQW